MGKFFTAELKPDIINGDVSVIQNANKSHLDVGAGTIIFDWTEITVPRGANLLRSILAVVNCEDGTYHASNLVDYVLLFAKSVNGVAPSSFGTIGSGSTGTFDLKDHLIGSYTLQSAAGAGTNPDQKSGPWHIVYTAPSGVIHNNAGDRLTSGALPMILQTDDVTGSDGTSKLYVCGVQQAARGYQTGVIVNGAITSDTEDTIAVDGVGATKIFSVGDTVYLHDVDTALGTIKSLTDTSIVLNAAIAGGTDIDDDDELLNANPIKITLGFEQ